MMLLHCAHQFVRKYRYSCSSVLSALVFGPQEFSCSLIFYSAVSSYTVHFCPISIWTGYTLRNFWSNATVKPTINNHSFLYLILHISVWKQHLKSSPKVYRTSYVPQKLLMTSDTGNLLLMSTEEYDHIKVIWLFSSIK